MKVERVDEANAAETQLSDEVENAGFALLAHDVRSSMFGLLGSLELIDTSGLPQETRDRLERARTSGALLNDLLGLVFGGPEQGVVAEPIDIRAELRLMSQRWFDPAKTANVSVEINLPEDALTIDAIDRVGFHRIFNNLVGNSIKFGQNGMVWLDVTDDGENAIFTVRDKGPGFSADSLEMLFEFRGRPEDSPKEGSGLGLFIAKSLVAGAGGAISVENGKNGGACITVQLPKSRAPIPPENPQTNALPDLSHLKILLAEDNITNQLVVTQMLASMGACYEVASDGVEALEMFESADFDAVLLDIEMPRKSGLAVLREIRARKDAKSGVPLIALTAYVMPEHREKIDAAGADGLIAKPIAGIAPLGHQILEYVYGMSTSSDSSQTMSTNDEPGFIDMAIYDQIVKTIGPDFLPEFLEKVLLDFGSIDRGLEESVSLGNYSETRSQSHILISVAGAIGASNLQGLAQELNAAARSENEDRIAPLNLACREGILSVVTFLENNKTG